jgi:hypothetical protein
MWSNLRTLPLALLLAGASSWAQDSAIQPGAVNINLPPNCPLSLMSLSMADSRATARGAALALDLHMGATLRNNGANRIHGVTLRVVAQEVTLGGKGSVTYPSLNVGPNETFQVRIDMQLMRPSQASGGPLAQVDIDGVLFEDLSFFGPDRLNSRRTMMACEMEARRDREHFKRVLASAGKGGLQRAMLDTLARQAEISQLAVTVKRTGRAVTIAASDAPERSEKFAFLQFPDSPVQPVIGHALISGNEAHAPTIEVRNRSAKAVNYVEMGWIVSDQAGRRYMAGSLPSSDGERVLQPGQSASLQQLSTLNFSLKGTPVNVQAMVGFVSEVEFADGKVWVPTRQNLSDAKLDKVLPPSAEEQRLTDIYKRRGIDGLAAELGKF